MAVVVAVVLAVPVVGLLQYSHSFEPKAIKPIVMRIESLPCVTWATGSSSAGSDTSGAGGDVQVGLKSSCTAAQIGDIYDATLDAFSVDVISGMDFYVTPSATGTRQDAAGNFNGVLTPTIDEDGNSSNGVFDGVETTTVPQLTISSLAATTESVRQAADDWLTLRKKVDPDAQVSVIDSYEASATSVEMLTVNTRQVDLTRLRSTLPTRLTKQSWSVTVDGRSPETAFTGANSSSLSAATMQTQSGFPSKDLVDLALAGSAAWPSGGYVLAQSSTAGSAEQPTRQVSLRVFGVAFNPSALSPTNDDSWPGIANMIDDLDASGTPFILGLGVFSDDYTFDVVSNQHDQWDIRDDASLALLESSTCGKTQPEGTSEDSDAFVGKASVAAALSAYWLSPTRVRASDSMASKCS